MRFLFCFKRRFRLKKYKNKENHFKKLRFYFFSAILKSEAV